MNLGLPDLAAAALSNAVLVIPLAVIIAIVCRLVRRPAVAWCLWGLVLLKFVTPAGYPLVWAPLLPGWNPLPGSQASAWEPAERDGVLQQTLGNEGSEGDEGSELIAELFEDDLRPAREVDLLDDRVTETVDLTGPPPPLPIVADDVPRVPGIPGIPRSQAPAWERTSEKLRFSSAAQFPATTEPTVPLAEQSFADGRTQTEFENDGTGERDATLPLSSPASTPGADDVLAKQSFGDARPQSEFGDEVRMGSGDNGIPLLTLLSAVWAAGTLVLLTLAAVRVRRFRKLLRHAEPAPSELTETARALAAQLGCRAVPTLLVTSARVPPLLWGIGRRAVILLPRELLDELDAEQRTAVLAHELAHYARRDHLVRWFEFAVRSAYWWHPVAWLAGRKLREAEEQCCDAWVVRLLDGDDAPRRYADALLKTVDFLTSGPIGGLTSPARLAADVPPLATGITSLRRSLRPFHRRLTMIIHDRPAPKLTWPARLCLLALAAIVLPASIAATGDDASTTSTEEATAKTPSNAKVQTDTSSVHEATRNAPADRDADAVPKANATDAVHSTPLHARYEAEPLEVKVFRLANTRAAETVGLLNEDLANLPGGTRDDRSVQPRLAADTRTNSIVFTGTGAQSEIVEALVLRLDEAPTAANAEASLTREPSHSTHEEQTRELPQGIKVVVYVLTHNNATDVSALLISHFESAETRPTITPGSKESVPSLKPGQQILIVRGTDEQQQVVRDFVAKLNAPARESVSADHRSGETISVVRATYELPQKVSEALCSFIQQHGQQFEFLTCSGVTPEQPGQLFAKELGGSANMVPPVPSTVTIIATPEIQQQFGDFIRSLQSAQKSMYASAKDLADLPTACRENPARQCFQCHQEGDRPLAPLNDEIMLVRARYSIPLVTETELQDRARQLGTVQIIQNDAKARQILLDEMATERRVQVRLTADARRLLTAVKESNLVPLLLVSADEEGLTVTTTEEFQQALGKFIRFLQEYEEKAVASERAAEAEAKANTGSDDEIIKQAEDARLDPLRRKAAEIHLKNARELLKQYRLKEARREVQLAEELGVTFHLFGDSPELVLRAIDAREAANATLQKESIYSGPVIPIVGNTELGAAQLAMTRYREAEISAKLLALQEMLKWGTVNKPAMLLALGREEANNPVWTMLRELVELETTRDHCRAKSEKHPELPILQTKIDIKRKSLGLPTGDDTPALDLFDLYLKSLEHQLESSREVIKALQESGQQSSNGAGARKRLDAQIHAHRSQVALHKGILQAMEKARQDQSVQQVLSYLDSREFREQLETLAGGDQELVERSILVSKRLYELLAEQHKLAQRLHADDPRIKELNRKVAQELEALGIKADRHTEPQDYLRILHDEAAKRVLESLQKLNSLERERAALENAAEDDMPRASPAPRAP